MEEKLKKLILKIKYFRKIGKNQKADQIQNKINKMKAKQEYKNERGPTKVGKILKKVKSKVGKVVEDVKESMPVVKIEKRKKKKE